MAVLRGPTRTHRRLALRSLAAIVLLGVAFTLLAPGRTSADIVLTVTRTDDPPPDGCGPDDCSLREAVLIANVPPGPHTIILPAGTYTLTRPGPSENVGATGDLDVTQSATINGAGSAVTTIDGNDVDRILQVLPGVTASISGITLQNGDASTQVQDGGAISNAGTLTLTDVVLRQNVADDGGAIDNVGTLTLMNSKVIANIADDAAGGIQGQPGSTLMLTNTTVSGNQAGQAGGGLSTIFGVINAEGSTISGNTAGAQGGGAHVLGTASFINTTISANNALGFDGGGLNISASVTLTNVTITGNSSGPSGTGGGIFSSGLGNVTTTNSIIANNPTGGDCSVAITSAGHNLDSDNTCGLNATGDIPNTPPLLAPLANNLGPTQTHALLTNSPAMDAGDAAVCPATDQRSVARPLDGDGDLITQCDIGAVEAGPLDADSDGCPDEREAQTLPGSQTSGGLRDIDNFWDFYDVPTGISLMRDRSVSALDIFAVIGRFNAIGDSNIDPLSTPPPAPAYHTAFDRGTVVGPDVWDLGPANGSIAATDIFGVLGQFNHSCA